MSVSEAYISCADPVRLIDRVFQLWSRRCISLRSEKWLQLELPEGECELFAEVNLLQVFLYSPTNEHDALREMVASVLSKAAGRENIEITWRISLE